MKAEFANDLDKKKPVSHTTRNVLIGLAGIFLIVFILFTLVLQSGGYLAPVGAAIIGVGLPPILSILLGVIFYIAKKKTEGGIMLIISFVFLLIGLIVYGWALGGR